MKDILVLGGTHFFGRKLVELLIKDGHNVTIMTRGQSSNPFGDRVEHIIGDRLNQEELLKKVEGRVFDIVYDNICYSPNDAYSFCKVFNNKIGKLIFTSTLATYEADGKKRVKMILIPITMKFKWELGKISLTEKENVKLRPFSINMRNFLL